MIPSHFKETVIELVGLFYPGEYSAEDRKRQLIILLSVVLLFSAFVLLFAASPSTFLYT